MANSSRVDDDSPLSSSVNSAEKENSGNPSIEYDATAKSETSLAIMTRRSYTRRAGIFLSSEAVASISKTEDSVMLVCKHLMGQPFHSAALSQTSCSAANVSSCTSIHLLQGFSRRRAASKTSVASTIWMVASRVPTKTDCPNAGSNEISFPMTLAMFLTRCLLLCMKVSRMPRTLASLSSGTYTAISFVSIQKPRYSFL
jgi:hypothetical protein